LRGNKVGDKGAKALAPVLPKTLTELNLSDNDIGDEGAEALIAVLPSLTALTWLNLYDNHINKKNTAALQAAVRPECRLMLLSAD
jgi:Ran GTPase-activating protein (RanGAP) involved in mRNA processing and transport